MGKSVQAVDATETKPVSCDKWSDSEILSEVRRKQSVKPARLQYTPLELPLGESFTRQDMFSVQHSTQPVLPPVMPLESRLSLQLHLLTLLEDLLNPKQSDKPQCNDAAMSVGASGEPDTKESDSQPSQRKMQSSNAATLTDQSESQG